MAYVYGASENVNTPSTTTQTADRAACLRVVFSIAKESIEVKVTQGNDDGGGGVTPVGPSINHTIVWDEATTENPFDAVMDTLTNNGESLRDALERIILNRLNTDGVLPNGTI